MKKISFLMFLLVGQWLLAQPIGEQYTTDLVLERVNGFSANDRIEDIDVVKDMVWFGGKTGISSFNNTSSTLSKLLNQNSAVAIKVNRKGDVYSAFKNNKIFLNETLFHHIISSDVQINDLELFKSKLWVATNNGVYVFNTNSQKLIDHFDTTNSKLKTNQVNFVKHYKALDNLWIGTDQGVNEVKANGKWSKTDMQSEAFVAVTENVDGIWLLSDQELHLVYEESGRVRFQPQGLKKGLFVGKVNDLALDNDDNLYVASDILTRYNPYTDELDKYGESLGLVASKCISLASDENGALWLGTENAGLFRIYEDSMTVNEMMITTILENPISCPGAMDGSLKVEVSGGQPPYKYYWERVRLKGKSNPKRLKSGNYKITVEDDFGNRKMAAIRIDDPLPLKKTIVETRAISSIGRKDGFAKIDISGGTPPYDILWDNNEKGFEAKKLNYGFNYVTITDFNGCEIVESVKISKPKIMPELDIAKVKVGQTLQLNKLYFKADSSAITEESYAVLEEVYEFMQQYDKVHIEIGGHTNNIPPDEYCDRLSTDRAKSVSEFLYEYGIPENRITYKGYGKRNPIASNNSAAGRKRNQRVEIKILQID